MSIQAKLLRAIEAREIVRIGASRPTTIDVRFVCATNRDLATAVAEKRFRHDLYFRIDGISLRISPLRDRRGMIARLALGFAQAAGVRGGLSPQVLAALEHYAWPGNVRELKAVVERAALLSRGKPIAVRHLAFANTAPAAVPASDRGSLGSVWAPAPVPILAAAAPDDLDVRERAERLEIIDALEACAGNQTRAAARLESRAPRAGHQAPDLPDPRPRS